MRLLPKHLQSTVGWMPYVWLFWLGFLLLFECLHRPSVRIWVGAGVVSCIFLPLYFLGYWLEGKRKLWVIVPFVLMGGGLVTFSPEAFVFFIYAGAFAGFSGETGFAVSILGALVAIMGVQAWVLHLPLMAWVPFAVFTAVIGAANMQYAQRVKANARLRLAHEEIEHLAKTAERERIARDLHDVLGHTLSVIILKSELASRMVDKDLPRAAQEIRDVERISRDALAEVRRALKGYRAAGLDAEIAQARATLETAGIKVQASSNRLDLSPAQEGVLALVIREAVTNILRHSQATECGLRLLQSDGVCSLEIADNGCGSNGAEGEGLKGMRQRVETLGGNVQRKTSPGTTLTITLPRSAIQTNGVQ